MSTTSLRGLLAVVASSAVVISIACDSSSGGDIPADVGEPAGPVAEAPPPAPPGAPPASTTPTPPLGDGAVQFIGRFETTDPAGPKASWPGSRIVARFSGTSVSVTLREFAWDWMDAAPSFWDVAVDRVLTAVLPMVADDLPHTYELAANLPPGEHEVELYKRTEMQTGVTQFLGFDFHGGTLRAPPPRATRHIEAMADSYGTGYGIEVLNAPELRCPGGIDHAGRFQNFRKAWPQLLADRFGAEIEGTVYSGKGLTRGKWATDIDGLIDYYPRSNPDPARQNEPPLFDLGSWVPDVIVLVQGTVDNGIADFRNVYRDFVVKQLRARAPNAHIFLVVPGFVARAKFIDVVNSVARERNEAGDLRVYPFVPGMEEPEEMTGCGFHGAPSYHQRIAREIGDLVAAKVGW